MAFSNARCIAYQETKAKTGLTPTYHRMTDMDREKTKETLKKRQPAALRDKEKRRIVANSTVDIVLS